MVRGQQQPKQLPPGGADGGFRRVKAQMVTPVPDLIGTYANFASVGHSTEELTIDFALLASTGDGREVEQHIKNGIYPATGLTRVRLPFGVARNLVEAIGTQLLRVEEQQRLNVEASSAETLDNENERDGHDGSAGR